MIGEPVDDALFLGALAGAFATLGQRDMKRVLAYSTLAVLGTLVMLLGVGTEYAVKTAVVYLAAHAMYKAALFMVAGNVDHETGTRNLRVLGGLRSIHLLAVLMGVVFLLYTEFDGPVIALGWKVPLFDRHRADRHLQLGQGVREPAHHRR